MKFVNDFSVKILYLKLLMPYIITSLLFLISANLYGQENPWESIGPYMGDINSMAMDNEHPDTVYAATPSALFRTMDGAENWEKLSLPDLEVDNVVVSQNQSNMVLCHSEFNVFLSNDYGDNWKTIWSDTFRVKCITFNPDNPNTILIGTDNRHHTTNGWSDPDMDTPYFYKSIDGGSTWDKVYFNGLSQSVIPESVTNIIIDPSDTLKIYITGDSNINCGIYVSHNNGADWTYKFTYTNYAMACTPAGFEDHTLCVITRESVSSWDRILLISKDEGLTWEKKYPPTSYDLSDNLNSGNTIYIDLDDPKYINFGMKYEYVNEDENYSSSVGAYNIEDDKWYYFVSCPNSFPSSILICGKAFYLGFQTIGVYKYEGDNIWSERNKGICSIDVIDLAHYPESPEKVIIAMDENLYKTNNLGQSWNELGDTYNDKNSVFIFPNDTAKLIAGIHSGWLSYGSGFYIYKSNNGGKYWNSQKLFTRYGNITQDYKMWVTEIVGSPGDPDVIFIGVDGGDASSGAGIYKSGDGGSSWEIKRTTGVSAIAVDPVNNDIVYSGTSYAGYVSRSEDAGETWIGISPGGQDYIFDCVNDLAVDNSQQVFAATTSGLYIWEGNEDWALMPGFPVTNTTAIVIDNSLEEPVFYVGTSGQGIFMSDDGGQTWENFNTGLGSSKITKLQLGEWEPKYLYAGTSNGGAWVTLIPGGKIREYVSICEGESYEGHTESGQFERTLTSTTGADSIVTTILTVHENYEITQDIAICQGEIFDGHSEVGQYVKELKTVYGCDSIVTINITIDPNGMCYYDYLHVPSVEYPTIQSAIDAAEPEDTVLVDNGIFSGNGNTMLTLNEKNIVVKSKNGPESCIIDGEGSVFFGIGDTYSYDGLGAIIEGFTIRNFVGNGIYYYAGSCPDLRNNIIENCGGGGILFWYGSPLIENNIIQNNESFGIECYFTQARIISNIIRDNKSNEGAGIYIESSTANLINNIITNNQAEKGGGIYCKNSANFIINNTIVENSVSTGNDTGGAIYIEDSCPDLVNNIIALSSGKGIISVGESSLPYIKYNDIYGNDGGNYYSGASDGEISEVDFIGENGNISEDPLLSLDDYSLSTESPCIDAGTPDTTGLKIGLIDFYGNPRIYDGDDDEVAIIDIGAYEKQSNIIQTEEYISICQGEEYEGHTDSETFQRTLTAATGADSIVTTYLTVNPNYEMEEFKSICEGDNYLGLTEEGNHFREFETISGCDSTVIIHLTVNPTYESEEYVSICEGDNYLGLTEEGDHERAFESVYGCDSIVTTHLSFYPPFKPTFDIEEDTLISVEIYSGYQWFDENGSIEGATGREYTIDKSGDYYLKAQNENGCFFNSDTIFVRYSYAWDISQDGFTYSVMPNPNDGNFSFRIDQNPPAKLTLKLLNTLGQEIETRQLKFPEINQTEQFNVSHLSKGIYQLIIYTDSYKDNRKIVVN